MKRWWGVKRGMLLTLLGGRVCLFFSVWSLAGWGDCCVFMCVHMGGTILAVFASAAAAWNPPPFPTPSSSPLRGEAAALPCSTLARWVFTSCLEAKTACSKLSGCFFFGAVLTLVCFACPTHTPRYASSLSHKVTMQAFDLQHILSLPLSLQLPPFFLLVVIFFHTLHFFIFHPQCISKTQKWVMQLQGRGVWMCACVIFMSQCQVCR